MIGARAAGGVQDPGRSRRSYFGGCGIGERSTASTCTPSPTARRTASFHGLVPDGVFTWTPCQARAAFHPAAELTDTDVVRTLRHIKSRVRRLLLELGKLDETNSGPDADRQAPDVLLRAW